MVFYGPGKLCREWQIDKSFSGVDLTDSKSPIWLAGGVELPPDKIEESKRIGISQAKDILWRFTVKDHPSVSTARSRSRAATRPRASTQSNASKRSDVDEGSTARLRPTPGSRKSPARRMDS